MVEDKIGGERESKDGLTFPFDLTESAAPSAFDFAWSATSPAYEARVRKQVRWPSPTQRHIEPYKSVRLEKEDAPLTWSFADPAFSFAESAVDPALSFAEPASFLVWSTAAWPFSWASPAVCLAESTASEANDVARL